jgi:hypothetical protein
MQSNADAKDADRRAPRRAYRAPAVADFGDVEKLTQGISGYIPG